jgi:UDP-glucose 4-epimerase
MLPRKIIITGVAGFIGSNLADRLVRAGHTVVGIDNLSYGVREQIPAGVEFHAADIRSANIYPIIKNADVVFHLAAKNCISDCQSDPVETADVNVTGTVNVFEAARKGGVRKIIYAESSALYEGTAVFPTGEAHVSPISFYATSKLANMAFAGAYKRFSDVTITALRYFCVYGPRQDYRRTVPPVMSAFIINLLKGNTVTIYGSGEKRRDFVYVDDVNDFHLQCIDDERTDGGVFNIGSGENHSVNDIYREVCALLEVSAVPEHEPDLPGEAEVTLADITAARRLGWNPATRLREGIEHSIDYIKRNVLATA